MKKKLSIVLLSFVLIVGLTACGGQKGSNAPEITAEYIVAQLEANEYPITDVLNFTEETDTNGLLGRPGKYTSKTSFDDTRDEDLLTEEELKELEEIGYTSEPLHNCTVEVFANGKDANTRYEYIQSLQDAGGFGAPNQYMYLIDNAFLRISFGVTPAEAKKYEKAFKAIMANNEVPKFK